MPRAYLGHSTARILVSEHVSGRRFDLCSAVLCALMFGSLISGINGLGHGQAALAVAGEFIGAGVAGYVLLRRQAAQDMPLLPIDLFRRPIFSVSVTTSVLCFIAQGLAFVSLPFYFQDVIGVSAVATGLLMTPWPATSALMAPFAGRLADRYPAGILGSIGLVAYVTLPTARCLPIVGEWARRDAREAGESGERGGADRRGSDRLCDDERDQDADQAEDTPDRNPDQPQSHRDDEESGTQVVAAANDQCGRCDALRSLGER